MRKVKLICMLFAMVFLLAGCGKVAKAEQAINAIGKVTIEAKNAIETATDLVESLSARRQEKISNLIVLTEAREEYNRLTALVDNANNAILGIGTVTLSSGDTIQHARDAYTALEADDLTEYVSSNYPVLLAAENQFTYLCAEAIFEIARQYYEQEKYAEAMLQLKELEQTYPNSAFADAAVELNVKCIVCTADALYNQGRYEEAIDVLNAVIKEYPAETTKTSAAKLRGECHMAIATNLYNQEQFENAVDVLDAFITGYPAEARLTSAKQLRTDCHISIATNLYNQGQFEEAANVLDAYINKYSSEAKTTSVKELGARCYVAFANDLYNQDDLEGALLKLDQAKKNYQSELSRAGGDALKDQINNELEKLRPKNGKVLENHSVTGGYSEFTVEADSNYDSLVKLERVDKPEKYVLFYVRAGEKATISVKEGDYYVKYTSGTCWYGENAKFGRSASFTKADEIMEFSVSYEGYYVYYSSITITLYTTFGGNLSTSTISENDF